MLPELCNVSDISVVLYAQLVNIINSKPIIYLPKSPVNLMLIISHAHASFLPRDALTRLSESQKAAVRAARRAKVASTCALAGTLKGLCRRGGRAAPS